MDELGDVKVDELSEKEKSSKISGNPEIRAVLHLIRNATRFSGTACRATPGPSADLLYPGVCVSMGTSWYTFTCPFEDTL